MSATWQTCDHPPLFHNEKENLCAYCQQIPGQLDALDLVEQPKGKHHDRLRTRPE